MGTFPTANTSYYSVTTDRPQMQTISVVTPCRNAGPLIEPTVKSIIEQTALRSERLTLQYLIYDGDSDDDSLYRIQQLLSQYRLEQHSIIIRSMPDSGPYDALAQALATVEGDIVAYLNAGDRYHSTAFDTVADIFDTTDAKWITGLNAVANAKGQIVSVGHPYRYRRSHIKKGIYGRVMPFIQQESTFWHREIQATLDLSQLRRYQYAGDFYLWTCFADVTELVIVEALLGSFCKHRGQRSDDLTLYIEEMDEIRTSYSIRDVVVAYLDHAVRQSGPMRLRKKLNPNGLLRYEHRADRWW